MRLVPASRLASAYSLAGAARNLSCQRRRRSQCGPRQVLTYAESDRDVHGRVR
jgi:hypothetical protein